MTDRDGKKVGGGVRETLAVAWPLAMAMVASGAVNHVCDRFFLARCSDAALAASLPAMMVATIFTVFFATSFGYVGNFVSQFHGDGRGRDAVAAFAQGLWLTLFAAPVFLLLVPACWGIVDLAGHAPAVRAAERAYLLVYAPGSVFTVLNVVLGGVITGQGRTRLVSVATALGCLANLAFDPLFIFGWGPVPALGITGAAVASVLAQATTSVLLAIAVARDGLVRSVRGTGAFRPDRIRMLGLIRFGVPAGVSASTSCIAFTLFTLVVAKLDGLSSAASNTVFAVNNIFYLALCATSEGVRILAGRYHGAGDDESASRAYYSGLRIAFVALALCFAVVLPCSGLIMDLFRGADSTFDPAAYRALGGMLFVVMFVREFAEALFCVSVGALRGVGDTKFVMWVQTGLDLVLWAPSVLVVYALRPDVVSLWLTMPFNLGLIAAVFFIRWRRDGWRKIRF